ncbi:MAG TPA: ion channel [Terriglobales bacterium]|nr:ion channel [Terriglobales bacterium]
MHWFASIGGMVLIYAILLDAFETVVLPRRIQRHFRIAAWFYKVTWLRWTRISLHIKTNSRREGFLAYFGPLSLIQLLGFWAFGLIFGFSCVQYGLGEHFQLSGEKITFGKLLYHSGETFFTLGYGDIVPTNVWARALAVIEAGMGFAFLGVVVGYLPVIYNSFASREVEISLLDARAGSPPTPAEFLGRLGCCPEQTVLDGIFRDWERWCADLLSSHISYPALLFFRSQHSNQSWLGALTTMLDVTSLIIMGIDGIHPEQAKLTFAMARHAAVDLAQTVSAQYDPRAPERLTQEDFENLRKYMARRGVSLYEGEDAYDRLRELRELYEPYVQAMSVRLRFTLPPWTVAERKKDNWQASPWDQAIQAQALAHHPGRPVDDHF